jgi:hypothetical protein
MTIRLPDKITGSWLTSRPISPKAPREFRRTSEAEEEAFTVFFDESAEVEYSLPDSSRMLSSGDL